MINNSKLPREALEVLTTLKENGYESYLVGGCVRDLCLGKAPKDWDLTTMALPEQVIGTEQTKDGIRYITNEISKMSINVLPGEILWIEDRKFHANSLIC